MEEGFKAGKHSYLPGFVPCIGSLLLKELNFKQQVFDFSVFSEETCANSYAICRKTGNGRFSVSWK